MHITSLREDLNTARDKLPGRITAATALAVEESSLTQQKEALYNRLLEQAEDPYLSTRAEDIRDLGRRVLNQLRERPVDRPLAPATRHVLVAEEMSVAHLAAVPPERLAFRVAARHPGGMPSGQLASD